MKKFILTLAVLFLLLNTAFSAPNGNEDYDPEFGEDDKDMQNDNDDYGDEDEGGEDSSDMPEPTINTIGQDFIARENETVYLPCDATNADNLVTFWLKNEDYIFQDDISFNNFGTKFERLPNRTLVIKNVEANYTGDYTCSVVKSKTDQVSITHKLFVQSSPSIVSLEAADNKTVYEHGDRLVLVCKASGYPKPTIIWSFKGKGIVGEGDSITIDNISHTDAGPYQCLADNKIGNPAHKAIRISVVHKPVVKIEKITVNSAENYDSELICTVHAVPDAIVNWKKNGVNIKPDDRISIRKDGHSYILKISKTQKSDFGEYTCSAVNREGKSEKNVELTGTPSPPRYFRGYEDRETKVPVLSWTIESNSPITEHVLQYRKVGDNKWNVVMPEVTNPEGNIYTIKQDLPDLDQGQYEVKVRSRNTYGWSQWSETKNFNGVVAQRAHMHHSHPSTPYDLNHSGPETKSLDINEDEKENIRQDTSTINSGQERITLSSLLFLCLAFLMAHQQ